MDTSRANLNKLGEKPPYALFALIFLLLSALGIFVFFKINLPPSTPSPLSTPSPTPTPYNDPYYPLIPSATAGSPAVEGTPVLPTADLETPTLTSPTPQPSPTHQTFTSQEDRFSANYSADRTLHQDQETSGNRYTFYSPTGSITVHVGTSWSWSHPSREFSPTFKVDGHDTFRYDISLQTIVDIDGGDLKYTIQCIHNAKDDLKSECDQFLSSFKFL